MAVAVADTLLQEYELQRQLLRLKARKSLKHFIAYTYPEYEFNWHHEHLIKKVESFAKGDIQKLMVFMPPQHGKSEICIVRNIPYLFGLNPSLHAAGCSYGYDLAFKFNRSIKNVMSGEAYQEVFDTTLTVNNAKTFLTNAGGSYRAVGVDGPLTGNRVDIGIIDDPIKGMAQTTPKQLERINVWYDGVFFARLHNYSQQLLIMTRWHEYDLAGYLLSHSDDWEVISYPAIRDNYDTESDPRELGEALWPARHNAQKFLEIKERSPSSYEAIYMQRPSAPDGNLIKPEWFREHEFTASNFNRVEIYVDGAFTRDKSNDPTGVLVYGIDDYRLFILHADELYMETPELIQALEILIHNYGVRSVRAEPKGSGQAIVPLLRKTLRGVAVIADKPPTIGKEERAHAAAPFIQGGQVFLSKNKNFEVFKNRCARFPNDLADLVDCLTAAVRVHCNKYYKENEYV